MGIPRGPRFCGVSLSKGIVESRGGWELPYLHASGPQTVVPQSLVEKTPTDLPEVK